MERLPIHHVSNPPPKRATTTAVTSTTTTTSAGVQQSLQSLNFHALRITTCGSKLINNNNKPRLVYTYPSSSSYSYHHHRQIQVQMATLTSDNRTGSPPRVVNLSPIEATPETFQEFGQVIEASPDGDEFGPRDAQLDLSRGTPRFYIMHLKDMPLKFSTITHHASVTQCFGAIGGHVWYLGVAKPSVVDNPSEINGTTGADLVQSRCGHFYVPPSIDDVHVFRISGPKFLKLNRGTWHAGPLFLEKTMDFYNLELSNTNVVDHTTHNFIKNNNVVFSFDE